MKVRGILVWSGMALVAATAAPAHALAGGPAPDSTMTTVTRRDANERQFMRRLAPRLAPGEIPHDRRATASATADGNPPSATSRAAQAAGRQARGLQRHAAAAVRHARQDARGPTRPRQEVEQQARDLRDAAGLP